MFHCTHISVKTIALLFGMKSISQGLLLVKIKLVIVFLYLSLHNYVPDPPLNITPIKRTINTDTRVS